MPTAIKAQLQEGTHNSHQGHTRSSQFMSPGRMHHWDPQNTYYIRPFYQDQEKWQLYLIYRNKYREADKMRKQRSMSPMKEQNKTPDKELNKGKLGKKRAVIPSTENVLFSEEPQLCGCR